jgi:hypothetical protein
MTKLIFPERAARVGMMPSVETTIRELHDGSHEHVLTARAASSALS